MDTEWTKSISVCVDATANLCTVRYEWHKQLHRLASILLAVLFAIAMLALWKAIRAEQRLARLEAAQATGETR